MKVVDHETSKEENQKWGNIARIRAIDPDFNAVIEALEKEANEKIEVKKVEVEGLMRDVNREYKKEVSKIESQYMKEKLRSYFSDKKLILVAGFVPRSHVLSIGK